jgi:hypothetical protein
MGAISRRRPAPVPAIAPETMISEQDGTSSGNDRALQSAQRTFGHLGRPAALAGTHPTLRDSAQAITLVNGTNWIPNRLGRVPRFIYIVPLAAGMTAWFWKQQAADLDMTRIDLEVTSSGPVSAIVRME